MAHAEKISKVNVTVMGLGYIGLPAAALIAGKGFTVNGVDVNRSVVDTINKGRVHIVEPELEGLVHYAVHKKLLTASLTVVPSDVFLLAVPTPFRKNNKPDLSYIEKATKMVLPHLMPGNLFIIESTSPVGTTEKIAKMIFKERPDLKDKLWIAYCPERVLPGSTVHELQHNDRVIGGIDEASTEAAVKFYSKIVRGNLHRTNSRTAEMCKLVENAYRDVNIAFANEVSMICHSAGIDAGRLIELACKHPRVNILKPGPGVGGHCIAVDPWFIVSDFPEEAKMIRQAREINTYKTDWVMERIREAAKKFTKTTGRQPVIACMGLTYKADIDDLRESPSLHIYHELLRLNYRVLGVEPNVKRRTELEITDTIRAVMEADIIVFLVAHKEFKSVSVPGDKLILDFCGINLRR